MTSLCYIEQNDKYLMLHRVKKENDENKDKWIGIGGKFEEGESPEECAIREIKEETGLTACDLNYRGIVTFVSDIYPTEYMHLFTCKKYEGNIKECDEGVLEWISKKDLYSLNLWEGDRIFLELMDTDRKFFSLKLVYKGDALERAVLDNEVIK